MSPTPMVERDPLAARLERLAEGEARRTSARPGLDGAIRRERRERAFRRGVAGALAASLAVALTLPFTPVRVAPLDDLAAALGLRERAHVPDGLERDRRPDHSDAPVLRQDVAADAIAYRQRTGEAFAKVPAGTEITDDAWLRAASDRAYRLVGLPKPDDPMDGRTLWAGDDGTWVRAVVTYTSPSSRYAYGLITLTGPTGTTPARLALSGVYGSPELLQTGRSPSRQTEPGTFTAQAFAGSTVDLAALPDVDADGTVEVTWHRLRPLMNGSLGMADLPDPTRGWVTARIDRNDLHPDVKGPFGCTCGWQRAAEALSTLDDADPAAFLRSSWLGRYADLGYAGAVRNLSIERFGAKGGDGAALVRARIAGVRTPGGGWLVSGDLTSTADQQNPHFKRAGQRLTLPVAASAAPSDGGTPLVGLAPSLASARPPYELPSPAPTGYVVIWAPNGVNLVRSGEVTARVVDGIALLDLRTGGRRVARHTPEQAVLVEGLDAAGVVVARTRVNEPDDSRAKHFGNPGYVAPSRTDLLSRFVGATNRWDG